MIKDIESQISKAVAEFIDAIDLKKGQILVVGCSSSEVCGDKIGSNSNYEVAETLFNSIYSITKEKGIFLATQCCEHLNRAIITERVLADKLNIEEVNVVPMPKAGGSFSTAAYKFFDDAVAVEHIKADAGIDIGDTLIGMHLKEVAVPVRISVKKIGEANLVCARTRRKFVGGTRAVYNENLM